MIQFNLLPDVKLEYIKARRTNRLVIGTSLIVSSAALVIFILLFMTVNVFQKKNITDLTADIKHGSAQLQSIPELNKVLTIQNQLSVLPGIHDQKAIASPIWLYARSDADECDHQRPYD